MRSIILMLLALLCLPSAGMAQNASASPVPEDREAQRRKACEEAQTICYQFSHEATPATSMRLNMIYWQAGQLPQDQMIFFGDSITEGLLSKPLCGFDVLNAGVMGVNVQWWANQAASVLHKAHPKYALLAIGVNNAPFEPYTEDQFAYLFNEFRGNYARLLKVMAEYRATPIVTSVLPFAETEYNTDVSYKNKAVQGFNTIIRELVTEGGLEYIDCTTPIATHPEQGPPFLDPSLTLADGVHLSAEGYAQWHACIKQGIAAALAKDGLQCR